jgi:hypothetical protein
MGWRKEGTRCCRRLVALSLLLDTVNNPACNGNELWKNIPLLFSCLSAGGAWYTQRSAVGEDLDSHDDLRPVHRDSVSVPSVYELIEQVKTLKPIIVMVTKEVTTGLGP